MYNKQLRLNIKELDLRIAKLGAEIEQLGINRGYEGKLNTLTDLVNLRGDLIRAYGDEPSEAVKELDRQIDNLMAEVKCYERDEEYKIKLEQLDTLTKVRCQLAESRLKGSHAPVIISGLLGIGAILLVLHYEKTDIITSKAFGIATKMFRGI